MSNRLRYRTRFAANALTVAPTAGTAPVISGNAYVGSTLTTTNGTWNNNPTSYSYQWKRGVTNVGTNQNTYVPVTGDIGSTITVVVTASNGAGSAQQTSAATAAVIGLPTNTVIPAISGTASVGSTLTATTGTWTGGGSITYAYQWKSAGSNVGTNQNTYVPVVGDIGNTITVTVTATNAVGSGTPAVSNATSAVVQTDPNWASVRLLMNFDGTDASTTFVDLSSPAHTLTAVGSAQLDTAQFKYGTASLLVDGNDDCCSCGSNSNLATATNTTPWTVECFIRFNSVAGDQAIFGTADPGSGGVLWRLNGASLDWFNWASGGGTVSFSYPSFSPSTGIWYYVCMEFDGTKTRMYTGTTGSATMRASLTQAQLMNIAAGQTWAVGAQNGGAGRPFNGWIDEFRYTNGVARYATDTTYTIPTSSFPTS